MSNLADLLDAVRTFDREHPPEDPASWRWGSWRKLDFNDGEGSTYFVQQFTGRVMRVKADHTVEHGWT